MKHGAPFNLIFWIVAFVLNKSHTVNWSWCQLVEAYGNKFLLHQAQEHRSERGKGQWDHNIWYSKSLSFTGRKYMKVQEENRKKKFQVTDNNKAIKIGQLRLIRGISLVSDAWDMLSVCNTIHTQEKIKWNI